MLNGIKYTVIFIRIYSDIYCLFANITDYFSFCIYMIIWEYHEIDTAYLYQQFAVV